MRTPIISASSGLLLGKYGPTYVPSRVTKSTGRFHAKEVRTYTYCAAIVAITALVVAWCRLPSPSSSPLPSTADPTPPTMVSRPPRLVLLPPLRSSPPVAVAPSPPSRSTMAPSWTGMRHQCPPSRSDVASAALACAPLAQAPPSRTPQCLGLRRPSFASRAAAAGRATATAARRR
jgi:hypothetical protein